MSKLRQTVQRSLLDALDAGVFTAEDFEVTFGDPEDGGEPLVTMRFKHSDSFDYVIDESPRHDGEYEVARRPGKFLDEETVDVDFSEAIDLIAEWCQDIRSELKAAQPLLRELDKVHAVLLEHIRSSLNEEDEFSVEEVNELREKLAALDKRVTELEKEQVLTRRQVEQLLAGIQQADESIDYFPKDTWLRTTANKLSKLVASITKTREGRKVLAEGASKLLGLD